MTNNLAALSEAATKGELYAMGWGDGSTQMGMTNLFNDDAAVCLMECIPEADAKFIAALWNTYRSGDLVLINREGMRERVAKAICRADPAVRMGDADRVVEQRVSVEWHDYASAADAAIAAMMGEKP